MVAQGRERFGDLAEAAPRERVGEAAEDAGVPVGDEGDAGHRISSTGCGYREDGAARPDVTR